MQIASLCVHSDNNTSEIKNEKTCKDFVDGNVDEETGEPLDLADLDLSRLRLSKKDLETLSNIAPGLPKCFQQQLLAKLPPTQARKLSRTLSVQTNQKCSSVKIYKRSQSSGRNEVAYIRDTKGKSSCLVKTISKKSSELEKDIKAIPELSKQEINDKSESKDENMKDSAILQSSDINDKYKYYSPYLNKITKDTSLKCNANVSSTELSPCGATLGRPPSGRLSPPTSADSGIKRPTLSRISRLIRPDLLEISQEGIVEESNKIQNSMDNEVIVTDNKSTLKNSQHIRNKSLELISEQTTNNITKDEPLKYNLSSLSRSRDLDEKDNVDKHQLADKILHELQILSSMQVEKEEHQKIDVISNVTNENPVSTTVKKVKKVKTKEKPAESSTDVDSKNTNIVIKKVKKIVKKTDAIVGTPSVEETPEKLGENNNVANVTEVVTPKKMSKLKRPKSYPMKESISANQTSEICSTTLTTKVSDTSSQAVKKDFTKSCNLNVGENNNASCIVSRESRLLRPKSYPTSKLLAPKEPKNPTQNIISTIEETTPCLKPDLCILSKKNENISTTTQTAGELTLASSNKKVSKTVKKSKLSQPSTTSISTTIPNTNSGNGEDLKESSPTSTKIQLKEKTTEKKTNKGLLYVIGQKFEKLRASATSNSCANMPTQKKSLTDNTLANKINTKISEVKKTKSLGCNSNTSTKISPKVINCKENRSEPSDILPKPSKNEKRSRIDTMIRNLRERSVPKSQPNIPSESNYIKRAVSVEEMPGTFNKKSVNKMLGLFKRYEKGTNTENRVWTTQSTSNIERHVSDLSPIYQNADIILKQNDKLGKNNCDRCVDKVGDSNNIKTCKGGVNCNCDIILSAASITSPTVANSTCPDCCIELSEKTSNLSVSEMKNQQEGNQEKRKCLMLELLKTEKGQNVTPTYGNIPSYIDNEMYSNISQYSKSIRNGNGTKILTIEDSSNNNISSIINNNAITNNNSNNNNNNQSSSLHTSQTSGYRTSSIHEINQNNNLLSPSFENIGNYSSDSRSYQEDCASTSTFLSPTEEAELCFDTWSVCSEDNYRRQQTTPSPTVSRLSRASQASSPTRRGGDSSDANESVVDRIKRRSFYCRFNEKKPKRTSSIVGPNAVREYYREKDSTSKTRSSTKIATTEREHSPDITQEFFRPLKLSPIGTELKPPVYRSPFSSTHDYSSTAGRPRKSLNDIRTPTSPSGLSERRQESSVNPDNDLFSNNSVFTPRYKINNYEEVPRSGCIPSNTYYNTYNPKRRFSFTTNTSAPTSCISSNISSPQIEGYATMGRRPIRNYDHRTISFLDPSNSTTTHRYETNTPSTVRDYTTSLSRSNSRYRKSSTPRSPNNI